MKDPKEIAIEAVIGTIVPSGLLIVGFALAGINPDELLSIVRAASGEARALLATVLLASTLLVIGVSRRWGPKRVANVATPRAASAPITSALPAATEVKRNDAREKRGPSSPAKEPAPKNPYGWVKVGNWMPEIATVEHAGVHWTSLMYPITDAQLVSGSAPVPDADDFTVQFPPLCPKCKTDLEERLATGMTLDERIAGTGRELFCVGCGWTQKTLESASALHGQAVKKMRGILRRTLEK